MSQGLLGPLKPWARVSRPRNTEIHQSWQQRQKTVLDLSQRDASGSVKRKRVTAGLEWTLFLRSPL